MKELKHKIFSQVENDLEKIETALKENLGAHLEVVTQSASHILFSGGKRLRPLLMVLAARLCNYKGDLDYTFSTVFEYLHVATLLHDDIVDEADLRRKKPVANSIWGNATAVLTGDFLLARSLSIGTKTGKLEVISVISEITENMSQGEIHQLMKKGDITLSEAEYMDVIRRKTAVLLQGACQIGAIIADVDKKKEAALANYGLHMGYAFQMADDLLDYTSDTESLGKKVGADLREGKMTLPLISALQKADEKDRQYMINVIEDKNFSEDDFDQLVRLLDKYDGIAYTRKQALFHIDTAKKELEIFDSCPARNILFDIADYVIERKV
ncbi:polyprenyl synthetase family protein [Desulfobacterales bacterium HSG16]|nr:polyprenyl synthetase family protein [Desulfobacterales bacterium HSG16]